jgi:hypothetical protein
MPSPFPPLIVILPCLAFVVVFSACLYQFVALLILNYRIRPDHIQIVVFGLPVKHIKLQDITDIRKVPMGASNPWTTLSLHNRIFGQWLLIRRQRGVFRNVLITPAKPDEFIETVARNRAKIESRPCSRPRPCHAESRRNSRQHALWLPLLHVCLYAVGCGGLGKR